MEQPPKFRRPPVDPDLEAEIYFFATDKGGKKRPVASGYRPNHNFGLPEGLNGGMHEYPAKDWVYPGETVSALIWLLIPERQERRLHEGFTFMVQEGSHIIGKGIIVKVINPKLAK